MFCRFIGVSKNNNVVFVSILSRVHYCSVHNSFSVNVCIGIICCVNKHDAETVRCGDSILVNPHAL